MPTGLQLAETFYRERVASRIGLPHGAALLGDGSEVLGLDDEVSTDHDFGERVQIFARSRAEADAIREAVGRDHRVEVTTPSQFFRERLGFDPADGIALMDWLTTPTQRLATLTTGRVFADADNELRCRVMALEWYPDDVWRYVLAAAWLRVEQEQAFVGRAGSRGDDLGSRVVAARLVRDLMRIAFLVERRWAPYSKWFGTAFGRLALAAEIGPVLAGALAAHGWREREAALVAAGSRLIAATNRLDLASPVSTEPMQFFDRDIRIIRVRELTASLLDAVVDPQVRDLVGRCGPRDHDGVCALPGAVDQAVDSVDVLTRPDRCRTAAGLLGLGE